MAVLAADIDTDGIIELYTIDPGGELLRWRAGIDGVFAPDTLARPEIVADVARAQLASYDVDGDGIVDLIVSSTKGWTALAIGADSAEPLFSVSQSGPSMLTYSAEDDGLSSWPPGPGRYSFITMALSGLQDDAHSMRSNASGIGTRVAVRSGSGWSLLQTYRNKTGPGQSLQPLAVVKGHVPPVDLRVESAEGELEVVVVVQAKDSA